MSAIFAFFSVLFNTLAPVEQHEEPRWFYRIGRLLISLTIIALPLLYDPEVAEVAGDPRWYWQHITAVILITLFFLARTTVKEEFSLRWPIICWLVLGLAITAIISIFDAVNYWRSVWFLKHFLAYCVLFGFAFHLRSEQWFRTLPWLLILTIPFNSVLGILQFFAASDAKIATLFWPWMFIAPLGIVDFLTETFRQAAPPAGTFANKNLIASWLVFVLPLAAGLFFTARTRAGAGWAGVCFSLGLLLLLYTRSRASWLAFTAALVFFTLWLLFHKPLRIELLKTLNWKRMGVFAVAIACVVWAGQFTSPITTSHSITRPISEQVGTLISSFHTMMFKDLLTSKQTLQSSERKETEVVHHDFGPRLSYNLNGLAMVRDNPLTGVGIGSFHAAFPLYFKAIYPTPDLGYNINARPDRTENDLMEAFVSTGILGGLFHLGAIGMLLVMLWQLGAMTTNKGQKSLGAMPLFIATASFGLCVNALMDFPFQMPTAPGHFFILMGAVTGIYLLRKGDTTRVKLSIRSTFLLPRPVAAVLTLAALAGTVWVVHDTYQRREGDKHLKFAMSYVMAGYFGDETLTAIDKSNAIYPHNTRMHEFRGVIYANYVGTKELSFEQRLAAVEDSLTHDPYTPNNLINLGGIYVRLAQRYGKLGQLDRMEDYIDKVLNTYNRLLKTADFAPQTWALGGYYYLLKNQPEVALTYFNKALKIEPSYSSATEGKNMAIHVLRLMGKNDAYINLMDAGANGVPLGDVMKPILDQVIPTR